MVVVVVVVVVVGAVVVVVVVVGVVAARSHVGIGPVGASRFGSALRLWCSRRLGKGRSMSVYSISYDVVFTVHSSEIILSHETGVEARVGVERLTPRFAHGSVGRLVVGTI